MTESRGFPDWDELYRTGEIEKLPWYWPSIDPDLDAALTNHAIVSGKALDIGTGPGTQAIALARRGFDVTATDVSPAALEYAARKAHETGAHVTFARADILGGGVALGSFDLIFDRGCFHVIAPEHRTDYARALRRLIAPSGLFVLKTFSHLQPGTQGPYRFTPDAISECFRAEFDILDVHETVYQGQRDPYPQALIATLRCMA